MSSGQASRWGTSNKWTCQECEQDNDESSTDCAHCDEPKPKKKPAPPKTNKPTLIPVNIKPDNEHLSPKTNTIKTNQTQSPSTPKESIIKPTDKKEDHNHASKEDSDSDNKKPTKKKEKPPSLSAKKSIPVYITITGLPSDYDDDDKKIEDHIRQRIKNGHRIDVIKVKYYSQLGVGVVYVQSDDDKEQLINEVVRMIWKPKQDQCFVSFESTAEFASYLVFDVSDDKNDDNLPTADDVKRQWMKVYKTDKPRDCTQLNSQFPNIYHIVTTSLEELAVNIDKQDIMIKGYDVKVYFCGSCSFFEDIPSSVTSKQLISIITKAIQPAEFSSTSFHVQLNPKTSTACVIATDAVRQWSSLSFILLNNKSFSKKNSLSCRLIVQSVPSDISIEKLLKNSIFRGKAKKLRQINDTLILEISDEDVYDDCINCGVVRIDGKKLRFKQYDPSDFPTGTEIDADTWYDTEMDKYDADISQFVTKFDQEIFRLRWNAKIWQEQFENASGENSRFDRGQRASNRRGVKISSRRYLLQMTVMLNTLGAIKDRKYFLKDREIPLNINKSMKTIVYNHQSKLMKSAKTPIRPLPFKETKVFVINKDCVDAYKTLLDKCKSPLLLNMANSSTPGGGYRKGETGQEENLFRRSDYYRSLDVSFDSIKELPATSQRFLCTKDSEFERLSSSQKVYPIEEFGAIYTSGVTIFRRSQNVGYEYMDEPLTDVSIIAVSAFQDPKLNGTYLDKEPAVGTRRKIENIFAIAHSQKHDSLVLSAFGCGTFHNPPEHVAQIFRSVIDQYAGYFHTILFAILDDHNTGQNINPHGNFKPFADILHEKTFLPAKSMDKPNTKYGSFRISNDGSSIHDVCIYRDDICSAGSDCTKIFDSSHANETIHPPICTYVATTGRCNYKSDRVHMSSFIHSRMCSYGGQCEKIKDEKHCQEFSHPSKCPDGGECANLDVNHLKEFIHSPLCKEGPKCMKFKAHDKKHCESYRHCKTPCSHGGHCVNIHDRTHLNDYGHPFKPPCSFTPFHCPFYTKLSEAADITKCDDDVRDHCLDFSHVCRWGRHCSTDSPLHQESTIHIIRRICKDGDKCKKLSQEEHLNSYSHPKLADIRRLCQHGTGCFYLRNLDHVTKYRHARNDEETGVVQLYNLNKRCNFGRNQSQCIQRINDYVKKQGWKPLPSGGIPRTILDYFRTVQPVHRCSPFIFESILLHGHVMSRDYMENLKRVKFVARSVMQHSRIRCIDGIDIPTYNKAATDYIIEVVRQEFAAANFPPPDPAHGGGTAAAGVVPSHAPKPNSDEHKEHVKAVQKILTQAFSKTDVDAIKTKAIEIAQASIKLHSNPAGIGFATDKELGTDKRVFSILGPHLGHYYGDVIVVFKREIMHHPDADFSMCAATTFGASGNAYRLRPWLTDPGSAAARIKHYHDTKLHAGIPGFEYAMALELMALTSLQLDLKTMDMDLDLLFLRWLKVDSHLNIEGHLPQLIPIDYIDHIYVAKNIFESFSAQSKKSLNAVFKKRYTIMDHKGLVTGNAMSSLVPVPADKDRADYQNAVVAELRKQYAYNLEYGASRPLHGATITIPPAAFNECFPLHLTISQAYDLYHSEKGHDPTDDIVYIYWQTINGDMMLVVSAESANDEGSSMRNCVLCYISSQHDSHSQTYHEQATYINIGAPIQHHKFIKNHKFKASSNNFHIGSNTDDYITYCLELHRSKSRVILRQAGSNALYNHEKITCDLSAKELNLADLEYISISSDAKEVSVRNLFVTFERQADLHPTIDDSYKKPPKDDNDDHGAASLSSASSSSSTSSASSSSPQMCSKNVNCPMQYSDHPNAIAHRSKYLHPCRFSELCRNKSKEPNLTHEPNNVPICKNDTNCKRVGDPHHRAEFRHSKLPDFLIPCRSTNCTNKSDEHRIKYSHGEDVYKSKAHKSSSKTSASKNPRTPCKWGMKCIDIDDESHCTNFSHEKSGGKPKAHADSSDANSDSESDSLPPCKWGKKCKDLADKSHCAKFSHEKSGGKPKAHADSSDANSDSEPDSRIPCKWGKKCKDLADKNHCAKFSHETNDSKPKTHAASSDSDSLPPCKWGKKCKDFADKSHRAKFSH